MHSINVFEAFLFKLIKTKRILTEGQKDRLVEKEYDGGHAISKAENDEPKFK